MLPLRTTSIDRLILSLLFGFLMHISLHAQVDLQLTANTFEFPTLSEKSARFTNQFIVTAYNPNPEPNIEYSIRMTIKGNGIEIRSNRDYDILRFNFSSSKQKVFFSNDLSAYFNFTNLDFFGYSKEEYLLNGLPRGVYSICFEVIGGIYDGLNVASNTSCQNLWVTEQYPPEITFPKNKHVFNNSSESIVSWLPRHSTFAPVKYEIAVFEKKKGLTDLEVFLYTRPVWTESTFATDLINSPMFTHLKDENQYLLYVKVQSLYHDILFLNNGWSEPVSFSVSNLRDDEEPPTEDAICNIDPAAAIINEIGNGALGSYDEFVELVVVGSDQEGDYVNLDGYIIDDNNFALDNIGNESGHIRLGSCFSNIKKGTIILIYDQDNIHDNIDPSSDGHDLANDVYQIQLASECILRYQSCPDKDANLEGYDCNWPAANNEWGNYIPMRNRGDVLQLRKPNAELEHALAWNVTDYEFIDSDKTVDFGPVNFFGFSPSFYYGTDWTNVNNWLYTKTSLSTPGKPNSKDNFNFINDIKNEVLSNNFYINCAVEYIVNAVGVKIYITDATPNSSYQLYVNGQDEGIHTSNPIVIPNLAEGVYSIKVINLVSGCEDQCDIVVIHECESGIECNDLNECTINDLLNEDCECFGEPEFTITYSEVEIFEELCDYCTVTYPPFIDPLYTAIEIHAVDVVDPYGNPITLDYDTNNEPNSPFNFPYCIGECNGIWIYTATELMEDLKDWMDNNNYSHSTTPGGPWPCYGEAIDYIFQTNVELLRIHAISDLGDPLVIDFEQSNCQETNIIGTEVTVSSDCGEIISVIWSNGFEENPIIIYNEYVACFDVEVTCENGCTYTDTYGECPCPSGMNEECCIAGAPCVPGSEYNGLCVYSATFDEFCNCNVQLGNDSDGDGVCDEDDLCPNYDDNLDYDGDGVPDGCDICHGQDDNNITDPDACEEPPCYPELTIDVEQYGFANCDYCLDLSNPAYKTLQHNFYFSSFSASPQGQEVEVNLLSDWEEISFCDFDSEPYGWKKANISCPLSTQNIQNPQVPSVAHSGSHAAILDFDTSCKYITSSDAGLVNSCQADISFWALAENFNATSSIYLQIWKDGIGYQTIKVFSFGTDLLNGEWTELKHIVDGPFTASTKFRIRGVGGGSTVVYVDDISVKEFHGESCIKVPTAANFGELQKFMVFMQDQVGFTITNEVDGSCGPGSHILVSDATYLFNTVKTVGGHKNVTHNFVSPDCGDNLPGEFEYDLTANVANCGNPSFLWSNGETTQTIHIPNEANYTVTVTCDGECEIIGGTEFEDYCVYGAHCEAECYSGYEEGIYDENCQCITIDQNNDSDGDGLIDCEDPCPNGPQEDNNGNGITDCLEPPCNCALEPFLEYTQVGYTTVNEFCFNVQSQCGINGNQLKTFTMGGQTFNGNSAGFNFPYNFNCDNPNSTNGITSFFSDLYEFGLISDIRYTFSFDNDPAQSCLTNNSYGLSIGNVPSNITSMSLGFSSGNLYNYSPIQTQVGDEFQITVNFSFCSACSDPTNISYLWSDGSTASTSPIYTEENYSYAVTVTCNDNCEYIVDPTWNPLCIIGYPCDDADPCTKEDEYQEDCSCQGIPIELNDVTDIDGDGVPNECDICPNGDDNIDSDGDLVPNACDQCPGGNDVLWLQYMNDGDPTTNIICDNPCNVESLPIFKYDECFTPCNFGESYTLTGFSAIVPGYGEIYVSSSQYSPELDFGYCNQIGQDPCPGSAVSDIYLFQYDLLKWFKEMNSQGEVYTYISGQVICISIASPIQFLDFYFTCGNIDFKGVPSDSESKVGSKNEKGTVRAGSILWGGPCDDDNPCTYFDAYNEDCECKGVYMDSDDDTVCDYYDQCPNWPDYLGCGPQFIPCPPDGEIPICEYYQNMVSFSASGGLTTVTKSNQLNNTPQPRVIQYSQAEVQCMVQELYAFSNGNPPTFYLPALEIQLADIASYDSDEDGIVDLLDMCPNTYFTGYYNASHFANCCEDSYNQSIKLIMSFMFEVVNNIYDPNSTKECSQLLPGVSNTCFNYTVNNEYSPGCATELGIEIYEDEDCIIRDRSDDCPIEFFINCDGGCDYFKMCQETHVQLGCEIICPELPCQISYVVQLNVFDPLDPDWTPECACEYHDLGDEDGDTVCDQADECPGGDDLMDTDGDGTADHCDQCPNVPGFIGDPCDDGNPCTYGDRVILDVDGNCQCAGRLVDFDGDGVYDCDGCESAIDIDGDGVAEIVEYLEFDTWDDDGNVISVVACDACPGLDDMLDSDEDGLPDCLDQPTYDIGCPIDVINVPREGILLVFSTDEVLMEDIPQPIQFSCPINGGNAAEVFQRDYLLIDNIREVDGTFEVFYSIPGFNTDFPYASVSYSGHQPCIVPESNVASMNCPSNISFDGSNIILEFTIPDGYVFDLLTFSGDIQFDLTSNSGGSTINSSSTITNNGILFPNLNDLTSLQVTLGGFSGLGNISSYSGSITLPNGYTCSINAGETTSPCDDIDGNPVTPGDPCDDNDPCTHHDVYFEGDGGICYCGGEPVPDEDEDGFCDAIDQCPGADDADNNFNGQPDGCECTPPVIEFAVAVEFDEIQVTITNDNSGHPLTISIGMGAYSGNGTQQSEEIVGFTHTFTGLNAGATYTIYAEYDCSGSTNVQVTIPTSDQNPGFCGILEPIDPTTIKYLQALSPGDIIKASDFDVVVDKASGGDGVFSGKGHLQVPYFNLVKVNATFYNITITDNYEMIDGEIIITGIGQAFIPDGFVDFLGTLLDNLGDLSDLLGDIIDILDDLSDVIDAMETLADWNEIKATIQAYFDIIDANPWLPDDIKDDFQAALDCFENINDPSDQAAFDACKLQLQNAIDNLASALAELFNSSDQIRFEAHQEQLYGYDIKLSANDTKGYLPAITVSNENYEIPWKAVVKSTPTSSDEFVFVANWLGNSEFNNSTISFEDAAGNVYTADEDGSGHKLTIPASIIDTKQHRDIIEIFAVERINEPSGEVIKLAGKFNVIVYSPKEVNVVVVPVAITNWQTEIDVSQVQDLVASTYSQAGITANVSFEEYSATTTFDNTLNVFSGEMYNDEMKSIICPFKDEQMTDTGNATFYFFLIQDAESITLQGFMPQSKGFGFIVNNAATNLGKNEYIARTVAHELGHGSYMLGHYSDDPNSGSSTNLMDYNDDDHLSKYQWDQIHDPQLYIGLYDENSGSESNQALDTETLGGALSQGLGIGTVLIYIQCPNVPFKLKDPTGKELKYKFMIYKQDEVNSDHFNFVGTGTQLVNGQLDNVISTQPLFNNNGDPIQRWGRDEVVKEDVPQFMTRFYKESDSEGPAILQYCISTRNYDIAEPFCTNLAVTALQVETEGNTDIDANSFCHGETEEDFVIAIPLLENRPAGEFDRSKLQTYLEQANYVANQYANPKESGVNYVYDEENGTLIESYIYGSRVIDDKARIKGIIDAIHNGTYFSNYKHSLNDFTPTNVSLSDIRTVGGVDVLRTTVKVNTGNMVQHADMPGDKADIAAQIESVLLEKIDNQISGSGRADNDFYDSFDPNTDNDYTDPVTSLDGSMNQKDVRIWTYLMAATTEIRYVVKKLELDPALWDPSLMGQYDAKIFTVYSTVAGATDGVLTVVKDVADLWGMIKGFVNDPQKSYTDAKEAIVNITWDQIKQMIVMETQDLMAPGPKGHHKRAKTVVVLAKDIASTFIPGGAVAKFEDKLSMLAWMRKVLTRLQKIKMLVNNPTFNNLLDGLSNLPDDISDLKRKFVDDFYDQINNTSAGVKEFFQQYPTAVTVWKGLPRTPQWARKNTDMLKKLDGGMFDVAEVDEFFKVSHQLPNSDFIPPDVFDGVQYTKWGFPKFNANQVFQPINKVEINMGGNYGNDFTQANQKMLQQLKLTDPNAKILSNPLRVEYNGVVSEKMTWHHMEDGKTMQLVKYAAHKGKQHTGGTSIAKKYPNLKGFFPVD